MEILEAFGRCRVSKTNSSKTLKALFQIELSLERSARRLSMMMTLRTLATLGSKLLNKPMNETLGKLQFRSQDHSMFQLTTA